MKKIFLGLFALSALVACKDEKKEDEGYKVPSTYNFSNVNYSGQTERLSMLSELSTKAKSGSVVGTTVSASDLRNMFSNSNNPFSDANLNASSKNLQSKCYITDTTYFLDLMDSLAYYSGTSTVGSNGVAGIVTNATNNKTYLVDANGFEYAQLIEKGLMGAVAYYQAVSYYLTDLKIGSSVDNSTVVEGIGTDMEHHFDEAFGYFGVPIDFPTNKDGIIFYGKYSDGRDGVLGSNQKIMNAWLKGRAAISNNDMAAKDAAVITIKTEWEKIIAGCALHYINSAIADISNDAARNHGLSECVGFLKSLKYNTSSTITSSEIDVILGHIGDNLYEVTIPNLSLARDKLAAVYGWESIKTTF